MEHILTVTAHVGLFQVEGSRGFGHELVYAWVVPVVSRAVEEL